MSDFLLARIEKQTAHFNLPLLGVFLGDLCGISLSIFSFLCGENPINQTKSCCCIFFFAKKAGRWRYDVKGLLMSSLMKFGLLLGG